MNDHNGSVTWRDGTNDFSRTCSICRGPQCQQPVHLPERYAEVVTRSTYWAIYNSSTQAESAYGNPDQLYEEDVIGAYQSKETHDELSQDAYSQLTDKQKEVWDLVMRQGLSEEQAAEKLETSRPAVQNRLRGAKAKFTNFIYDKRAEGYKHD